MSIKSQLKISRPSTFLVPLLKLVCVILWLVKTRKMSSDRRDNAEEVVQRHRFMDLSEREEAVLVDSAVPANTKSATNFWWSVFESFCREKRLSVDIASITASAFAEVLKKFYGGLKTKKGGTYQASSYTSARAAIQRKLFSAKRPFNLRLDKEFKESNILLDAIVET